MLCVVAGVLFGMFIMADYVISGTQNKMAKAGERLSGAARRSASQLISSR